jgi:hypothetical protein
MPAPTTTRSSTSVEGSIQSLEADWARLLQGGSTVDVTITVRYTGSGLRPTQYLIDSVVTHPDGSVQNIPYIFRN